MFMNDFYNKKLEDWLIGKNRIADNGKTKPHKSTISLKEEQITNYNRSSLSINRRFKTDFKNKNRQTLVHTYLASVIRAKQGLRSILIT